MNYEHISPTTLEVTTTRMVILGRQVQMVPSYGYAGVDTGPAKIIGILHHPTDGNDWNMLEGHEGYLDDVRDNMESFMDVELSMVSDDTESTEYREYYDNLYSEPWIAYRYLRGHNGGEPEINTLPLSLFLCHSVPAI